MTSVEANVFKDKGNDLLRQGDVTGAIEAYTKAIEIVPTDQVFYSNRAAAYARVQDFESSLKDGLEAVRLAPNWSKGYGRCATALQWMKRYAEAIEHFDKAIALEPGNAQFTSGRAECAAALEAVAQREARYKDMEANLEKKRREAEQTLETARSLFVGDVISRVKDYPETKEFLEDPDFVDAVNKIKRDPSKLEAALQTDRKIQTFVAVALQYEKLEHMSADERRKVMEKQMEARERELREADEADDRRRAAEKKRKAEEEARRKAEEDARLSPEQKEARALKDEGNDLYKKKDFAKALEKYERSASLDTSNIISLNNMAAVYLEMGEADKCIEVCERAVTVGRDNRVPFSQIGRALQRIGSAYLKKEEFETAIEYFNKSLTEDRTAETLKLLRKAESLFEEKKKRDYFNPELSAVAKEEGNAFFRSQKYPEAVEKYTEAIKRNPEYVVLCFTRFLLTPSDHLLYSNRATAYTKLMAYPQAIKDLDECIRLKPDFVKAYVKKAGIHLTLKEYKKCLEVYQAALEFEPDNEEVASGIRKVVNLINSGSEELDATTVSQNVARDPELLGILKDPVMQQVLNDLQNDPSSAERHMRDPSIRANIEKLIAAGVIRTK